MGKTEKPQGVPTNYSQSAQASPGKPTYPYGTCIEDLYSHSWMDSVGSLLWFSKGSVLAAAEQGLGFHLQNVRSRDLGGGRGAVEGL
jgi:hypothetical protein